MTNEMQMTYHTFREFNIIDNQWDILLKAKNEPGKTGHNGAIRDIMAQLASRIYSSFHNSIVKYLGVLKSAFQCSVKVTQESICD